MDHPKRIRINGRVWSVTPADLPDDAGECDYTKHEIRIDRERNQHHLEARDSLLHEVFHGIIHVSGVESLDADVEEKFVRVLASGLIGVLQDNPSFARWLIRRPPESPSPSQ